MAEIDKIKVRVFHLLNRTTDNGCTEAEAVEAMKLAGKLMDQYNLSITDVQIKNTQCVVRVVQDGKKSRGPMDNICTTLARYCDVKIWFNLGKGQYSVFGLPQDTELFEYLFEIIKGSLEREYQKYLLEMNLSDKQAYGIKKGIRASFSVGFMKRMNQKLQEMKASRNTEIERTGRQLVLVKDAVVEEAYKALNLRLRTPQRTVRKIRNSHANSAGFSAANNVSLNHGVGGGKVIKRLT
jgi:hypothetical protein